jgi:hypothetical protein
VYVYRHRGTHQYLATNPKVMSRTLRFQDSLERVVSKRRYVHFAAKAIHRTCPPYYALLTRDPYARTESFFRDKLRLKPPRAVDPGDRYPLKRCQTILLPWLGVSVDDPVERQVDALLGVEFEEFVALLPRVYLADDHLSPQTWNYERSVLGRRVRMRFDRVVPIEDATALAETAQRFDLDLTQRVNAGADVPITWTATARATVRQLYREDFAAFGYPDE